MKGISHRLRAVIVSGLFHVGVLAAASRGVDTRLLKPPFDWGTRTQPGITTVFARSAPIDQDPPVTMEIAIDALPDEVRIAHKRFVQQDPLDGMFERSAADQESGELDKSVPLPAALQFGRPTPYNPDRFPPAPDTMVLRVHRAPRLSDDRLMIRLSPNQDASSVSATGSRTSLPQFWDNPPPAYPRLAIARRWQGTLLLRVHLTETGRVSRVDVVRGSGYAILDAAAVTAIRNWRAHPAIQDGVPISSTVQLPVRFRLP